MLPLASGAIGSVNFGPVGGTIRAAQSLYASPTQFTGNGTLHINGLVSDANLRFDATHGLIQSLLWNANGQNVSVNLDMSGSSARRAIWGRRLSGNRFPYDSRWSCR